MSRQDGREDPYGNGDGPFRATLVEVPDIRVPDGARALIWQGPSPVAAVDGTHADGPENCFDQACRMVDYLNSGWRFIHEGAEAPDPHLPVSIEAEALPGWTLQHLGPKHTAGQPNLWICALSRAQLAGDDWTTQSVQAQSDVSPLEAFREAYRMAVRDDDRRLKADRERVTHQLSEKLVVVSTNDGDFKAEV